MIEKINQKKLQIRHQASDFVGSRASFLLDQSVQEDTFDLSPLNILGLRETVGLGILSESQDMYPHSRYMDPSYPQWYPLPRGPNYYPFHEYPHREPVSPNIRADAFEPWPHNTAFCHPNPTEPHTCTHNYPSGYYSFRPPYSQMQMPPQMYYHGPYPPYFDPYHNHFVPPPQYSVDHAQYDPDKAKYHCCGCPNHSCSRSGSSVKIEEHPHESEPSNKDLSSLVQLPKSPHPVVWFPPGYSKGGNDSESWFPLDINTLKGMSQGGEEMNTRDVHDGQMQFPRPIMWKQGFENAQNSAKDLKQLSSGPLDINTLKGMRQGGEEKNNRDIEDGKMQFPWPIMWKPGFENAHNSAKDMKKLSSGASSVEEPSSKFKVIPLKLLEDVNHGEKPEIAEDVSRSQACPETATLKKGKTRMIPVVQADKESEVKQKETIPVAQASELKQKETGDQRKPIVPEKQDSRAKRTSDSKPVTKKPSKLPPVCLRVDPLPKKKSTNGGSHRPSSPLHKNDNKDRVPAACEGKDESSKVGIRVVDINNQSSDQVVVPVISLKNSAEPTAEVKAEDGVAVNNGIKEKGNDNLPQREDREGKNGSRRELSESEAALVIQSAYRGWEVRKLQPLDKLRKIARVREQMANVKMQIEDLEKAPKQHDTKQRVFISETIMNLLLQLDTIQGLHPSLREIRKSVARDLVSLQEKVDCLGNQSADGFDAETVTENHFEDTSNDQSLGGVRSSRMTELVSQNDAVQPAGADGPLTGQALADTTEHSVEPSPLTETKDPCSFEEASEPHSAEEENNAYEVVERDSNRTADVDCPSENLSLKLDPQELQEPNESGLLVSLSSEDSACDTGTERTEEVISDREKSSERSEEKMSNQDAETAHTEEVVPDHEKSSEGSQEGSNKEDTSSVHVTKSEEEEVVPDNEKSSERSHEGSNQEDKPSVHVTKSEEAADAVRAEEPELKSNNEEEFVKHSTGEGDTKLEELQLLPSIEVSSHGEHKEQTEELFREREKPSERSQEQGFNQEEKPSEEAVAVTVVKTEESELKLDIVEGSLKEINQEEKPSEEAVTLVKTEEPELKLDTKEESLKQSIGEGDEKQGELELLPSIKEISHDEDKAPETLAKSTHASSPVSEEEKDLSMGDIESGEEVARETIAASYSEVPVESVMSNDEAVKGMGIAAVPALIEDITAQPEDKAPSSAVVLKTEEKKLAEENEKLRMMLENLIEVGKQQIGVILDLSGRVKDLESKLVQKKVKVRRSKLRRVSPGLDSTKKLSM